MWKLTIEDEEGSKTLLPLVRDEYHVGRDETCAVRLPERNISRKHATLKKNGGAAWHIIDHDSYNGCYVNGQRVAGDQKLANADVIQLGDYRIFITNEAATELDPSQGMGGGATSPGVSRPVEQGDRLIMLAGPEVGREFPLNRPDITIGRAEDCAVSINHPSVSRVHAEIKPLGGGRFEIFDRGSANGLRVNGTEFRRTLLEGGDLLELGDVKLRFIERGQIYRPYADLTQQLSAMSRVPTEDRPGAVPVAQPGKKGLVIGAAVAGVVVLLGLALVATSSSKPEPEKPAVAVVSEAAASPLDDARKAYADGDYATAVQKLNLLPEDSPSWKLPEVPGIYTKWAEWAMKKADASSDAAEKRALLGAVAQSTHVSAELRKKAADLLAAVDATKGGGPVAAVGNLPDAPKAPATAGAPDAPPAGTAGGTKQTTKKEPGAEKPAGGNPDPTSSDGEMKMRKVLEGKMNSGKATKDDLKMLKAICQHQGDAACKAKAQAAISKL